jgi:hypothetical protein
MRFGSKLAAQIEAMRKRQYAREHPSGPKTATYEAKWQRYKTAKIESNKKQRQRDIAMVYQQAVRPRWFLGVTQGNISKTIDRESKGFKPIPFIKYRTTNGKYVPIDLAKRVLSR